MSITFVSNYYNQLFINIIYGTLFCQVDFFDDVGTVTLQFMDTLFQRDNLQKSEFFRGLPKILKNLPKVQYVLSVVKYHYISLRNWHDL